MSSDSPERWEEISPYLDQALTLSREQRAAWLAALRQQNPALADNLKVLLDDHDALAEERFLEGQPSAFPALAASAGQTIGAYRLTSPIGQGGMSTVWAAERSDGRFEGRVAIKFLNIAMSGQVGAERLKREGGFLGRLTHPNIARLMDAGLSAAGQPYLVLEYIEGEPIDRYCDARKLDVEARIRLFLDVLAAVAHAHTHLIVHRDIKPSNVLVRNDGQVKLLDFGIAKLLHDQEHGGAATLTREGGGALTPQYAAPEQLTGAPITTATDVYALGVLLYVLLTGQHPIGDARQPTADLVQAITATEPPRMSDVVITPPPRGREAADNAARRSTTADKLRRSLRGDLDTIVGKALKKQPQERYSSVTVLAADLERYLNHESISARPDTLVYRTGKFVRRNRTAVALSAMALVATIGGSVGTVMQARAARAQRDFAFRQLARAEAINDLQNYVLSNAAPSGKPFTLNDLLAGAERIVERQRGDPSTRVELLISIGAQYTVQDEYQKSRQLLEEAYRLSKNVSEPAVRARAACKLGQVLSRSGDIARAEALFHEGLGDLPDDPLYLVPRVSCWVRGSEIAINADRANDAIVRAQTARQLLAQSPFRSDPEQLDSMIVLASAYNHAGKRGQASAVYKQAAEQLQALGRDQTQMAATLFNNWGTTLIRAGQPLDAEKALRRSIEIARYGPGDDSITPTTLGNYAYVLYQLGRLDEATGYAEQAYAKARESGDDSAANFALMHRARIYRSKGDLVRSGEMLSELRARLARSLPPSRVGTAVLTSELALNAKAAGDLRQAKRLIDTAVSMMEALAKGGRGAPEYEGKMLIYRSEIELQLGQVAEAVADGSRAVQQTQQGAVPGSNSLDVGHAYLALGRGLQAERKLEQAQAAFRSAAENLDATLGKDHLETSEARRLAGLQPPSR